MLKNQVSQTQASSSGRLYRVGVWQARHEEHCLAIADVNGAKVVLLLDAEKVVEIALLSENALHVCAVDVEGATSLLHASVDRDPASGLETAHVLFFAGGTPSAG